MLLNVPPPARQHCVRVQPRLGPPAAAAAADSLRARVVEEADEAGGLARGAEEPAGSKRPDKVADGAVGAVLGAGEELDGAAGVVGPDLEVVAPPGLGRGKQVPVRVRVRLPLRAHLRRELSLGEGRGGGPGGGARQQLELDGDDAGGDRSLAVRRQLGREGEEACKEDLAPLDLLRAEKVHRVFGSVVDGDKMERLAHLDH